MKQEFKETDILRLHSIGIMIAVAVVYFTTARLSLYLAFGNTNATPVWPPSGIALAVILLWGYRTGPAVFAGAFFANLLALQGAGIAPAYGAAAAFATAVGNMLEGLIGAWCIRRLTGSTNPFNTFADLFIFIFFGSLLCTIVSASIGTVSFSIASGQWTTFAPMWLTWWLGDVTGILIVSPLAVMLRMKMRPELSRLQWMEAGAVFLVLILSVIMIFSHHYRLEYIIIPPLVWLAIRSGRLVSAAAILLVSAIAVFCTIRGVGPLTDPQTSQSLIYLQTYIGVISMITLCLSVLTHNRKNDERDLQNYKEHLEEIVKVRSASLTDANEQLVRRIEELDRTRIALSQSEKKYRDLVESANSVILRWKPDGSVTFFNTYAQKFFGFTESEIIGKSILGTIVPVLESSGRSLDWLINDIISHPEAHAFNENENIRRNGEKVWIAWTNKPVFDESGHLQEILSVGNDITKRKNIEESLKKTLDELALAKEQAEAADRIKSAFLAAMSHELRTPLNSIIGFTGIILQGFAGPLTDEQKKQLGMVQGSSQHLLSLINDVLDISKIEAGQLKVNAEPFDVKASIEKTVASMKPSAEKKGLALNMKIDERVGMAVGDQRRVEQILLNLLSNALKFTEAGSITLSASWIAHSPPDGANRTSVPEPAVQINIADTGIGIHPEDLQKLFQPFMQIDSGITRRAEGTGLGLAICRRLAGLMGGEITAASVWGEGSTFTFTLPLKGAAVS